MKVVFLNIGRINYDNYLNLSNFNEYKFYNHTEKEEIIERVDGYDIVIVKEMVMDSNIISKLPSSVKMICEAGTGYNNIDINACNERNIKVCNVPSYATNSVATFTMMFILNLSTSFKQNERMLANNDFSNFNSFLKNSYEEVEGKTLGIIGYGTIGKEVIKKAKAFGMNIICYSHTKREDENSVHFVSLDELLENSDYISLHSLLSEENYHMINKRNINKIKRGAYFINTSRGALVEEEALIYALKEGIIKAAALDVLENEPCRENSEFFKMDNVILTPHMAWNSKEARKRLFDGVVNNIKMFENETQINVVNS